MPHVLIIEDDPAASEAICKLLEGIGCTIHGAENGWEGLLSMDQRKVDLILLDLSMPGMDGATFLRILREDKKKASIPVIVMSGFDTQEVGKRLEQGAYFALLIKGRPDFYDQLIATVRHICG